MITRRTLLISSAAGIAAPLRFLRAPEPDLAIFHTNDVHGRVNVAGATEGLAYLAREIRRRRQGFANSLTLDAGDIIHGTAMEQRRGPRPVLEVFNSIGYDAATAGNHEFDFGPENFRNAARIAQFPFLSANVRDADGNPWGPLRPSINLVRGGRRIAIFGLTTLDTPTIQWPRTIQGIHFTDPIEAARRTVDSLRTQADLMIFLSHLGYAKDQELAQAVPGIDLIIGGHSHTRLEKPTVVNDVPIVQTGAYGKALGEIHVFFEGKRPRIEYSLHPAAAPLDSEADRIYGPQLISLNAELDTTLTDLPAAVSFADLGKARTPIGTALAECVRVVHNAEIGLFSSSQIAGQLNAGPVKFADLYRVMTAFTRQHIVRVRVPAALARERIADAGARVQVSGAGTLVAGPAHVIQDLFYGRPQVEIIYDDPLGPNVRDAIAQGMRQNTFTHQLATSPVPG